MQGSEIFIPKIPSMRITELAAVIAPRMPIDIVGVRPGEKLHEVMITEADARDTIELSDRYVICAPGLEPRQYHLDQRQVAEDFAYESGTNPAWLTHEDITNLLAELDVH
jgi:UDP-N-acetylglucosamine 4,6-dehydratase